MHLLLLSILCGFFSTAHLNAQTPPAPPTANLALTLDGDGDYAELPAHIFDDLKEATIEAWVKWNDFAYLGHWFYYGRSMGLSQRYHGPIPQIYLYDNRNDNALHLAFVESDLHTDQWYHFAAAMGPEGVKLYVNGVLVDENAFDGSFFNAAGPDFFLGYSQWSENRSFNGQIDEVRVWDIARSPEHIRRDMDRTFQQVPEHLVGYWNFDAGDARDRSGRQQHGTLRGDAHAAPAVRTPQTTAPAPSIVSGQLVDERDQVVVNAQVEIWRDGQRRHSFRVGGDGRFHLALFAGDDYELNIQTDELGRWLDVPPLREGQKKHLYTHLPRANVVSGTVRALDDQPLRNVAVDLMRVDADGSMHRETTYYSIAEGAYHFRNLRPGNYQIRCHGRGDFFYHGDGFPLTVRATSQLSNIDCTLPPVDKGLWKSYNALDGFPAVTTRQILPRADGSLLIFDWPNALWHFDGEHFEQQAPLPELAERSIKQIFADRDGTLWLATDKGILHLDGDRTRPVDCPPLAEESVSAIHRDSRGILWFASNDKGLWRYDGRCYGQISTANGLPNNSVQMLLEDRDSTLWIAHNKGVSHIALTDGKSAHRFLPFDNTELPYHLVLDIHQSRDGALWFGTQYGASRYDGQTHSHIPREYVERADRVYEDSRGNIWFGNNYNVIRYDGERFLRIQDADGQSLAQALYMAEDANGALWVAHDKGVSAYRNNELALFSSADGLKGNTVESLYAQDSLIWLGTDKGLERLDGEHFLEDSDLTRQLTGSRIQSIARDGEHSLWIGSNNGVWQWTSGELSQKPFDALSSDTRFIQPSGAGDTLLLATNRDLVHFGGGRFQRLPISRTLAPSTLLSDPFGGTWLGQYGYGLYHLYENHLQKIDDSESTYALATGERGEFWAGGKNSVLRVRDMGTRTAAGHPDSVQITRYLPREGLIIDDVQDLAFRDGKLYVANAFGGVALFDGIAWSSLDERDGLPNNRALSLALDPGGALWIGMEKHLVRYTPQDSAPQVQIASVQTDSLYSAPTAATVELGTRATVSYRAIDLRTIPEKRQYRHRIYISTDPMHPDSAWSAPTRAKRFEWTPYREGAYTFEVQAIDRDLNYSTPAQLRFDAFLPWYRNAAITLPSGMAVSLLILSLSLRTLRQRREAASLRERILEQERRARQRLEESNNQLQDARAEAERASEFKSTFLANMSHEIRTPLNAILGYAQILRGKAKDSEMRQGLDTIKNSGDHLLALIDEVLELSKIEAGRQQLEEVDFDLVRLIEELGAMFELSAARKGLEWRVEWSSSRPDQLGVRGDENKLRQVLINLLSNAVKFTNEGTVALRVECIADQHILFAVRDSGPGLSTAEQQAIFDPFKRAEDTQNVQGTGLGLSIARAHVELMGGQLHVESNLGEGARFFFDIPLPTTDLAQANPRSKRDQPTGTQLKSGQQIHALVADDVEVNRQVLKTLLAEMGISVELAQDGRQALQQMQQRRFDIAFIDVRMPELDGFGVLREARSQLKDDAPHIVAVTASALAHERRQYFDAGFDAFIAKPVRREDIRRTLSDLLDAEFINSTEASAERSSAAPPSTDVVLPLALRTNLRSAAEAGRLTETNKTIAEIGELGHAALAEHLQELARTIDLDAILALVDQLDAAAQNE